MQFNVSAEPISTYLSTVKKAYPKRSFKLIKEKFDFLLKTLQKKWPSKAAEVRQRLFGIEGEIKGNILIDKFSLLDDLRNFAENLGYRLIDEAGAPPDPFPFAHLINQGDADGIYIPIRFAHPLQLEIPGRGHPFPVGSTLNLRDELELLNRHLKVERTFRLHNMPSFIEAPEDQLEQFDRMYDVDDTFWIKFAFVVLRTINEAALEKRYPMIFHYV